MRKLVLIAFMAVSAIAFTACGKKEKEENTTTTQAPTTQTTEAPSAAQTTAPTTEAAAADESEAEGALLVLENIWAAYDDEEKFPAAGGDFDEENMVMDAPGRYGVEDAAMFDYTFGVPEADASLIDDAASLMHMMNANTFTGGAFHIADSEKIQEFAGHLKDNVLARQWMCGFPDVLVVYQIDEYVVSVFGDTELIETFETKLTETYTEAVLLYEEPLL